MLLAHVHSLQTVAILAGYTDKMDDMLRDVNPGLSSRFTERLEFPNWSELDCVSAVKNTETPTVLCCSPTGLNSSAYIQLSTLDPNSGTRSKLRHSR